MLGVFQEIQLNIKMIIDMALIMNTGLVFMMKTLKIKEKLEYHVVLLEEWLLTSLNNSLIIKRLKLN